METREALTGRPPDDVDRVLAMASLFNGRFSIDWLIELSGEKPSAILESLETGVREGRILKAGAGDFSFKNAKVRQAVSSGITPAGQKELHRRMADLLARELPDDAGKLRNITHHLMRIENNEEGCRWLIRGGDLYLQSFSNEKALNCYGKVLEDLAGSSLGEEADRLFVEAAIKHSKISTARYNPPRARAIIQEALTRASRWDRKGDQALLNMHLAKIEWLGSQYNEALAHFEAGWDLAKRVGDKSLLRAATTFSTFFLYWQGRYQEAVRTYEHAVPDIDKPLHRRFPLLAAATVGYCYIQVGQVTQGLGMLDAILSQSMGKKDWYLAAYAGAAMGLGMVDIGRYDQAVVYAEKAGKDAERGQNDWIRITTQLILAYSYYLNGDERRSVAALKQYLRESRNVNLLVQPYPYLMELCWAMDQGRLPRTGELSLDSQIEQALQGQNVLMQGMACRFRALVRKKAGDPPPTILELLRPALQRFEESGAQLQQARTRLEMARQYLMSGDEDTARKMAEHAFTVLNPLNDKLIPDDLRFLIREAPQAETLVREILKLGQEVVTIRENKDLIQHIISTVNRLTGAERGAIFLIRQDRPELTLELRATRNITAEQAADPVFQTSMDMIEQVAATGRGAILEEPCEGRSGLDSNSIIRSRICVPMILRNSLVGVLYHDNRLLSSAFKESDLELLSYFASYAAFALDNARAYEEIQRLNQKLKEEKAYLEEQHLQSIHYDDILGESPAIRGILNQVAQVAPTDTTVSILGETGVGKELVARAIHLNSPRRDKPFIRVHCSALPESLIPSELFGHEKGAFTGATHSRVGRFELADGGTLFLDEIGDVSMDIQVRLLRVIQSREFERVGGNQTIRSDFRLIVATNRDMEHMVRTNRFRADLYYRINVVPIWVPPLRDRKEDIPLLAHYFLGIFSRMTGKRFERISDEEMHKLMQYDWPGNVRELKNIMERGVILSSGVTFKVPELQMGASRGPGPDAAGFSLSGNERRHILQALEKTNWKVRGPGGAAELLEIHPSTLRFRMKKLGIKKSV
ncbi:MAG: sigma 54-interacting transcriptional regulator [Proteobacteria bacterium]|nr:sigma 54-interacting transcriptional regulator [Pseudomonadota bacterium]